MRSGLRSFLSNSQKSVYGLFGIVKYETVPTAEESDREEETTSAVTLNEMNVNIESDSDNEEKITITPKAVSIAINNESDSELQTALERFEEQYKDGVNPLKEFLNSTNFKKLTFKTQKAIKDEIILLINEELPEQESTNEIRLTEQKKEKSSTFKQKQKIDSGSVTDGSSDSDELEYVEPSSSASLSAFTMDVDCFDSQEENCLQTVTNPIKAKMQLFCDKATYYIKPQYKSIPTSDTGKNVGAEDNAGSDVSDVDTESHSLTELAQQLNAIFFPSSSGVSFTSRPVTNKHIEKINALIKDDDYNVKCFKTVKNVLLGAFIGAVIGIVIDILAAASSSRTSASLDLIALSAILSTVIVVGWEVKKVQNNNFKLHEGLFSKTKVANVIEMVQELNVEPRTQEKMPKKEHQASGAIPKPTTGL